MNMYKLTGKKKITVIGSRFLLIIPIAMAETVSVFRRHILALKLIK